jgi:hypothetical protein
MSLPTPRPYHDVVLAESTTSIATTPLVASAIAPRAGTIERIYAAAGGTTTGTIAVAVTVNGGSDITGGNLTIPAGSGARAASVYEAGMVGAAPVAVNEGDLITFTPSGGTGSNVPGAFAAVIR